MGWNNDIFPLLIVVSGPPFTGLFIYSPAPGTGNLVASITAQAGTDPYGNHYAAGISSYDGFGGQTELFGALIQLSSGLNILQKINPQGYVIYSPNAAAGNLVASIAPTAFTDAYGNSVLAGFTTYTQSAPFIASQVFNGNLQFWTAASQAGPWTANGPIIDDTGSGTLFLQSGSGGGASQASLQLFSGASQAATQSAFAGPVTLPNEAVPSNALTASSSILFAASGHLQTVSTATGGDGNNYDTERLSKFTAGTQLINSTTPATLTGLSKTVIPGTYRVEGIVYGVQGPAAVGQTVQFNGPGVSFARMYIESNADGNTSVTDSNLSGAFPEVHVTPAWGIGVNFYIRFKGIYTFTAAGTFSVQGASNTNTNTWTSQAACLLDLYPVVAS